ncbi:MAG: hypothetical protein FJ037_00040 [Chloroflexi bacterium]|nr:hypothetical protein [Chloroflexota bacterium]
MPCARSRRSRTGWSSSARTRAGPRGTDRAPTMPEIPDLEAVRHYLMPRLEGLTITEAEAPLPWLVRTGAEEFGTLAGHGFGEIHRLGKFLIWFVDDGRLLVVNPMLTGRFHWVERGTRKPAMLAVVMRFDDGHEVRYSDMRRMGRWYLVPGDGLDQVPQMASSGRTPWRSARRNSSRVSNPAGARSRRRSRTRSSWPASATPTRTRSCGPPGSTHTAGARRWTRTTCVASTARCARCSRSRSPSWTPPCRAKDWGRRRSGGST